MDKDALQHGELPFLGRSSETFNAFLSDSSYYTYECIPKSQCFDFVIPWYTIEDGDVFNYTIAVNRDIIRKFDYGDSGCTRTKKKDIVTRFGDNCPSDDLSAGAIAGIVVGSVVGLAIVVLVGYNKVLHKVKVPGATSSAVTPHEDSPALDSEEDKETPRDEEAVGEN